MNSVQKPYEPPRLLALCLGVLIFAVYHLVRRPALLDYATDGKPLHPVAAIVFSFILGYGLAMLWWLISHTKGQIIETFRPTRGRILGAIFLYFVTPVFVVSYIPWIAGSILSMLVVADPIVGIAIFLVFFAVIYVISAMIIRHTYQRRKMRFGLFCLTFWSIYSAHLLYSGVVYFNL